MSFQKSQWEAISHDYKLHLALSAKRTGIKEDNDACYVAAVIGEKAHLRMKRC